MWIRDFLRVCIGVLNRLPGFIITVNPQPGPSPQLGPLHPPWSHMSPDCMRLQGEVKRAATIR